MSNVRASPRPTAPLLLLLAALLTPHAAGIGLTDQIHGDGTASKFYVESHPAWSFEGGLEKRNLLCGSCYVKLNVTTSNILVLDSTGFTYTLTPGAWEIRDFTGDFSYTQIRLGEFRIRLEGEGRVFPLASYTW